MTRQTEQYLRNYLTKKALVFAADQEVRDAAHLVGIARHAPLVSPQLLQDYLKRQRFALSMQIHLRAEEAQAFDAYMEHLQGLS